MSFLVTEYRGNDLFSADVLQPLDLVPLADFNDFKHLTYCPGDVVTLIGGFAMALASSPSVHDPVPTCSFIQM